MDILRQLLKKNTERKLTKELTKAFQILKQKSREDRVWHTTNRTIEI